MNVHTLLVELLTEELPPKALRKLGEAFAELLTESLRSRSFLEPDSAATPFATPRRLAVAVTRVRSRSPDDRVRERIMPVAVAIGADGAPTVALQRKLASMGLAHLALDALERAGDGKAESLFHTRHVSGVDLGVGAQAAIDEAIARLPIPKVMTYQRPDGSSVNFVRPVHRLVALHGNEMLPLSALGLLADRITDGHRFQGARNIVLRDADEYESRLEADGGVVAGFARRRAEIERQIVAAAAALGARLGEHEALLDEVTALVERPAVYVGRFEEAFLEVPQECLILTMQQNQKYFPLFDGAGRLLPSFLVVSNMRLDDASRVVHGNERVIRPRLADARFFYDTDRREPLEARVERLASVVYHARLGSQRERVERLRQLAVAIAGELAADASLADRAALLCKADLLTGMVGEFPELQGTMGRYYALHDGEAPEVAEAIEEHYRPRQAGDSLPRTATGIALALADRLDGLAGIFGIGLQPTGDKDPFALRRQALAAVRVLVERSLPLDILALLEQAVAAFPPGTLVETTATDLHQFMLDRLRGYLRDAGYAPDEIESIVASAPTRLDDVLPRLEAVRGFRALAESKSLAAANKRIGNILRKSTGAAAAVDAARLAEPAEQSLHRAVCSALPVVDGAMARRDYTTALKALAGLRGDVDRFFDEVLVNAEDAAVRSNRLALLAELRAMMNRVADIGRLAA